MRLHPAAVAHVQRGFRETWISGKEATLALADLKAVDAIEAVHGRVGLVDALIAGSAVHVAAGLCVVPAVQAELHPEVGLQAREVAAAGARHRTCAALLRCASLRLCSRLDLRRLRRTAPDRPDMR